jgi:hypothetical protein
VQADLPGRGEIALDGAEGVVLVSFLRDAGHWVEGGRGMAKAGRAVRAISSYLVIMFHLLSYAFYKSSLCFVRLYSPDSTP